MSQLTCHAVDFVISCLILEHFFHKVCILVFKIAKHNVNIRSLASQMGAQQSCDQTRLMPMVIEW